MAPLPIMVTSEFAFSTKLTLKSDDGWQHQSLLLRLLKVAAWNGLNGDELAYVFDPDIFCQEWLLNKPQDLQWRKLRHLLKESNRTLSQAYPPFSIPIGHIQPTGLRGCRQCYRIGFHSTLYQLPFFGRCPLHEESIVDGCPECAYPVPYAITNPLKRTGFKCPNCQIGFFNLQAVVDMPNRQKLSLWRHWLSKLGSNQNQEGPIRTTAYIEAYRQWNWHYAEIPKCPAMEGLPNLSNLQSECAEHRVISEEAARRYYMLRRVLRHHFSKNDQKRYYSLIRQTWIPSPLPGNANYFGYIFWRFAWERSFARDHSVANLKQRHFPVTIEHWLFSQPLTESSELIGDIHQEMWRSYRRCQWLAQ